MILLEQVSSEYIVASILNRWTYSIGFGWDLCLRIEISNPLINIDERFRNRTLGSQSEEGTLNNNYFSGEKASIFGGVL